MRGLICTVLLLALNSGLVFSQSDFENGIAASLAKDYATAIQSFEKVVTKEPENVSALVNLGNCYYENKYYGKAILNYERALKIEPSDAEISSNIEACYAALSIQEVYTSPYGKIEIILYRIGEVTWAALALLMAIISAYSLFKWIKKSASSKIQNGILAALSFLVMVFFVYAAKTVNQFKSEKNHAIVIQPNAPLCLNEMGELSGFTLKEGTRIHIEKQTKDFYSFKDEGGNLRYLRIADAERF
jgi:tetratricopeptide (TPR) repeat protein